MADKKNKKMKLQEFLPAAMAVGRAVAPHLAGAALGKLISTDESKEEELEEKLCGSEVVAPADAYDPSQEEDVSEAFLSMLESQLSEEGSLDEFIGDIAQYGAKQVGKVASVPMTVGKTMAKSALGMGEEIELGEATDEEMEETYPAQVHYPSGQKPKYPRHKNAIQGEGTKIQDEMTVNRGAEGPKREALVGEETYPHQTDYPQDAPNFPRIMHVRKGSKNESFMVIPYAPIVTEQGGAARALMPAITGLLKQAGQIISQMDPQDISQIIASFTQMAQGIMRAKTASAGIGEGYLREAEEDTPQTKQWLDQWLAQMPTGAKVSDQEAQAIGQQVMSALRSGAGAGTQGAQPTTPLPQVQSALGQMQRSGLPTMRSTSQTPQAGRELELQRTGLPTMKGESKQIILTKGQLKEALKEAVLLNEKKKLIEKIVKKQIQEQVRSRKLCESLLSEGPLSGLWGKTGAKLFGGGAAQAGATPTATHQAVAQDHARQGQKVVAQAMKAVEKTKGKFNQETLKSANLINQYHDAVLNLVQLMSQAKSALQPMELQQLQSQVNQAVGQLQYDLESEKSGIDTFLDSLAKSVPGSTGKTQGQKYTPPSPGDLPSAQQLGQQAKADAERKRASEFTGQGTKTGRLARSPGIRRETKDKSKRKKSSK